MKRKLTLNTNEQDQRDSEYAPLKCGHYGCDNIGTISHGTDGKSLFYCRNHFNPQNQVFSTNPELAKKHLAEIYEHLGFKNGNKAV